MTVSLHNTQEAGDRRVGGDHYLNQGIQPRDALSDWMSSEEMTGFLLGNCVKYLARFNAQAPGKGGSPDLEKAKHYLERLIEWEGRA